MYTTVSGDEIDIFNEPSRLLVAGSSGSGKSFFTSSLINKYRHKFDKIIVIGSDLENCRDVIRDDDFDVFNEVLTGSILIIYDDVIYKKKLVERAAELYIRGRHYKVSTIFLSQNLFYNDKNFRIIALNCTHIVIFRTRDIKQISYFARTFLNDTQIDNFLKLYKRVVLKNKHRYLLVDYTKDFDSPLSIRTNVLNESYETAYSI